MPSPPRAAATYMSHSSFRQLNTATHFQRLAQMQDVLSLHKAAAGVPRLHHFWRVKSADIYICRF